MRLAEANWLEETYSLAQLDLHPGDSVELADVWFTAQGFGPVLVGAARERGQNEPLLLVTNLDFFAGSRFWYKKRFSGTRSASGLRRSSRARRAVGFTCATVTSTGPSACLAC